MNLKRIVASASAFAMLFGSTASAVEKKNVTESDISAAMKAKTSGSAASAAAKKKLSAPAVSAALLALMDEDADWSVPAPENWTMSAEGLPSKVDLRERGVVPPVRDQDPWSTCWGFGSIAASEIAILTELGLTCEQFKEKYGFDLDLSERHLAWYATYHMPEKLEENPELTDEDLAQAGEGMHNIVEYTDPNKAHFDLGGFALIASSVFAAGFGPVLESQVPYNANDGTKSQDSDWSVSEDTRFITTFDLLDSNILPSPAVRDLDEGTYTYNESATNAMKRELNAGHAIAIAYHGDISSPAQLDRNQDDSSSQDDTSSQEEAEMTSQLQGVGLTQDQIRIALPFLMTGSTAGMTGNDKYITAMACVLLYADETDQDELLNELKMGQLSPDEVLADMTSSDSSSDAGSEEPEVQYIDYNTYAQYTYDLNENVDHVVCVVGYDDDYPVANFQEGHQPPAPGAWICRNSWGAEWGNDGYFYLSYYDKTISEPETFVFDVSDVDNRTDILDILNYDNMQFATPLAVMPNTDTAQACVYTVDDEEVLTNAGFFSAAQDTDVVLSVYLLNEKAKSPVDGKLLDTQTLHYDYAGYHRVNLTGNYLIHAGSRVSVVAAQTIRQGKKNVPILPLSEGVSYDGALVSSDDGELTAEDSWYVAKVNAGESYVLDGGKWVDWKTVLDEVYQKDYSFNAFVFDNPSLKLYLLPFDQMQEIHHLDTVTTDASGNSVSVCDEDGYTVIR